MADPIDYTPGYSFSGFQASNPSTPLPAPALDTELADISSAIDSIVGAVEDIRRSDGALNNGIVTPDSLSPDIVRLLSVAGINYRGAWVTARVYAIGDAITTNSTLYYCVVAHTSGVFATDLAAVKWVALTSGVASAVTVTPTGALVATNVQAALTELDADLTTEINLRAAADTAINANNWVTTTRIADGNVTLAKLAANSVDSTKVVDGSLTNADLAVMAAGTVKMNATASSAAPIDTPLATAASALAAVPSSPLNRFRNGFMDINQRVSGTITAGSPAYALDGWIISSTGANPTWAQAAGAASISAKGLCNALQVNSATGLTSLKVSQRIEGKIAQTLAGEQVTLQFAVLQNTGSSVTPLLTVNNPTVEDSYGSVTAQLSGVSLQACASGVLTTVAYTFAATSNTALGLEVILDFGGAFNIASKTLLLTGADARTTPGVATGLNATPPSPERRPFHVELEFCRRYYEKSFPYATAPAQNLGGYPGAYESPQLVGASTSQAGGTVYFRSLKRVAPSVTTYSPSAATAQPYNASVGAPCSAFTAVAIGDTCFSATYTTGVGTSAGQRNAFHWSASTEL